jgi:hypothetical protein
MPALHLPARADLGGGGTPVRARTPSTCRSVSGVRAGRLSSCHGPGARGRTRCPVQGRHLLQAARGATSPGLAWPMGPQPRCRAGTARRLRRGPTVSGPADHDPGRAPRQPTTGRHPVHAAVAGDPVAMQADHVSCSRRARSRRAAERCLSLLSGGAAGRRPGRGRSRASTPVAVGARYGSTRRRQRHQGRKRSRPSGYRGSGLASGAPA